jgi:peptidoglycan pentaglycine glycine transferase (the first glycine)
VDKAAWNELIANLPGAHPLQTWEWGQVKSNFGWEADYRIWRDAHERVVAAALVLFRAASLPGLKAGWRVMYVPRGPVLSDWGDEGLRLRVFADLATLGRERSAILVKIDPEVTIGRGIPGTESDCANHLGIDVERTLREAGWIFSTDQIQFRNTVVLDLQPDLEDLMAGMKQKTRYNIRLAERRGVSVRVGTEVDFEMLLDIYAETALRDGFAIREPAYYQLVWSTFCASRMATPLIAEVDGEPVAGLFLFHFAGRAWYLYGMSREVYRDRMPNHLLQWEAIYKARELGCFAYDLWGAPDNFIERDRLWGVYRFKEGFGGEVVRFTGAWDLPLRPITYSLYAGLLPRIMAFARWRGRSQVWRSQAV